MTGLERFIRNDKWMKRLLWGLTALFTLLYVSLIFNDNVWTDEIFSMNLIRLPFGQIIEETAADVHPPLYYFLGRLFRLAFGESLQVQKVLSILPMTLTLALGASMIRKRFGGLVGFLYILLVGCIPCFTQYAVQVRMYSWSLLCVTACGLFAYEIWLENKWSAWLGYAAGALTAAYLHYFAFVSVLLIMGILFVALACDRNRRGRLWRWLVFSILLAAAYTPWLPHFYGQVTRVEGGYWIPPITWETVWSYFTWAFKIPALAFTTFVFIGLSALAAGLNLAGAIWAEKGTEQGKTCVFALLCMAVPAGTAAGGVIVSLVSQPIYRDQYAFPAMGLFSLCLAIAYAHLFNGWKWRSEVRDVLFVLLLLFLLGVGAISYRDNYRAEYKATLTAQTEAFFEENLGENDLVVYNYQAYYFNYKYYFPEDRLSYVREVDLEREFDNIWFLDTEYEWEFVPDQIIPYDLQIEYVGHYGIEFNEFDLYRVTKGKGEKP